MCEYGSTTGAVINPRTASSALHPEPFLIDILHVQREHALGCLGGGGNKQPKSEAVSGTKMGRYVRVQMERPRG